MSEFQSESMMYQAPSIGDLININDITVEDVESERFLSPSLKGHDENLSLKMQPYVLNRIAGELLDAIQEDELSRKDWQDNLKSGLEQLGLKVDQRDFPFQGAAGVYDPTMLTTVLEYSATAYPELLPIGGPVKVVILGEVTAELEDQAKRVENFANLYFTQIAKEFYPDHKKMYPWIGTFGNAFRKIYFDFILKRPTSRFIRPQDFIVNYGATDLRSTWRKTEILFIDKKQLSEKQKIGVYRDISLTGDDADEDDIPTLTRAVEDNEGVTDPNYDKKNEFTFFECHTYLDIKDIEEDNYHQEPEETNKNNDLRPYVITIHKKTKQILSIYRDWKEGDEDFEHRTHYVKYGFAEGFGFYNLGAAHLIGGLSGACTALLRQTIDGQTLANFPGGMYAKGSTRLENNNITMGPTEFKAIDTMGMPIRDVVMPMPYRDPSPLINELKKELGASSARIMGAANMQIADVNPSMPVGTTYALLGMMHKVQGSVMRSNRDSLSEELQLFFEMFAEVLPETPYNFDMQGGSSYISRHDFTNQLIMIPVADPHVTTEMQRLIRYDMAVQDANARPDLFDSYTAYRNKYKAMKLSDAEIDALMPPKEDVIPLDPVTENQNMLIGKAVKASIDQDHEAHNMVHAIIINDPQTPPQVAAETMAHISSHKALKFQIEMQQQMGIQLPEDPSKIPMDMQNQIAMLAAQAVINQQQQQQEQSPTPPLDPAIAMIEVATMETQVKNKGIDEKARTDELKVEADAFKAQLNFEAQMENIKLEREKNGLLPLSETEDVIYPEGEI
jgi:hypothetical protein